MNTFNTIWPGITFLAAMYAIPIGFMVYKRRKA